MALRVVEAEVVLQHEIVEHTQEYVEAGVYVTYKITLAHTERSMAPAYDILVTNVLFDGLALATVNNTYGTASLIDAHSGEARTTVLLPSDSPVVVMYTAQITSDAIGTLNLLLLDQITYFFTSKFSRNYYWKF